VELFLNGESLGAKSNIGKMNLSWDVPYSPGTLKAVAKTNGKVVAEKIIQTASDPARIQIIADNTSMMADGVSCIHLEINVVDKDGNFVPNADNLITVNVTGPANNIGFDNGDPLDLASTKINQRNAFNGKCLMILQSEISKGTITVEANSEGLEPCTIELKAI
jgi:beta-galactosidase